MRLNRVIKVVLPLGLLLLLGPSQPVSPFSIWVSPWTQVTGTNIEPLQQPGRNAGNAAPPVDANNIFSELPDRAAALWVPSSKDGVGPLRAVDALSTNDIWAVGETLDQPSKALVAHWDGVQWSSVASFDAGKQDSIIPDFGRPRNPGSRLYDVVALAPDDIWAVGEYPTWVNVPIDSICCWVSQILVVHWDGKSWQIVPSPQVETDTKTPTWWGGYPLPPEHDGAYGSLQAVTAVAKNNVWAVGYSPDRRTLILHWDGKSWDAVAGPDSLEDRTYYLNDIAATSANDIWAAGGDTIIHWDGKKWREVYKRKNSTLDWSGGFQSISATSSSNIWVGGYSHWSGDCEHSTLYIMHWNGSEWTDTIISDRILQWDCFSSWNLLSISALSQDDVWAVGTYSRGALVMHWNGSAWNVHNCPAKGLPSAGSVGPLSDVVVTAPGEVWAVGGAFKEGGTADAASGFVMRLGTGPCPPTPTPSPTDTPSPTYTPGPTYTPAPTSTLAPTLDPYLPPLPIETGNVPPPVPSSAAPGVSVGVPSRVAPAVPLP